MTPPRRVVVVGGGVAGHAAVLALRDLGYDGELTVLCAERREPYDRPPLSKELLAGTAEDATLPADYEDLDVGVRLGCRATGLDTGSVRTTQGDIPFDGAILAPGSRPRRLTGQAAMPEVLELRTHDDAVTLRGALDGAPRVVILGAGWIGAEVATAATKRGCRVTVLDAASAPLSAALPAEVTRRFAGWYSEHDVRLRLNTPVEGLVPGGVRVCGGERVPADIIVVGVGARPATGWLSGSALTVTGTGTIATDEFLNAGPPGVFAAGDAVCWRSSRYGELLSVEHWQHAVESARIASANVLGEGVAYDPVPYFWSHQFGHTVQYLGRHKERDRIDFHGDPDGGTSWTAEWSRDGRRTALVAIDDPRAIRRARPEFLGEDSTRRNAAQTKGLHV